MQQRFETFTVLVNKISRNIRKIKNQEMSEYHLRSSHISCLYYLYLSRGLTATDLCERCGEDKATISRSLDYLEKNDMFQEQCLLALAISCGARISELARFTTDLIDEDNTVFDGLFLETTKEIVTKGRGVNGKLLHKYILKDMFLPHYKKWLEVRKEIMEENDQDHDFVFITKDGLPANADRLRDWMGNLSDVVGKPLYMHSLRHYNVSMYKRIGLEDDFIVYLTGWSESTGHSMISIYNDMTAKDRTWKNLDKLKNALEQNNSDNN